MLGLLLLFFINISYSRDYDVVLVDAEQGSTVVLNCTLINHFNRWVIRGKNSSVLLKDNAKYENTNTSQMTIRNVDVTDANGYACDSISQMMVITLNVIVYATRERTVVLTCPFTGNKYEWYKNDEILTDKGKYINVLTSMISIRNVDYPDSGQYRCRVDNSWGYGKILLQITGTPAIEISGPLYNAGIGGNITLDCKIVDSNPLVEDLWWTDSKNTRLNNGRYSGGNIINPSITLTGVLASDSGYYYCNAKNSKGTSNASTQLSTGNYPSVDIVYDNYVSTKGNNVNVTIECIVKNGDNLLWYKDTIILPRNNKYDYGNVNNSYLVISDVDTADRGVYKCYVENIYGSKSDETLLNFVYTEVPISLYEGTINESVTLTCFICDATEVKWQHDDVNIPIGNARYCNGNTKIPSLTITNLTRGDSGTYQCKSAYYSITSISNEILLRIRDKPVVKSSKYYVETIVGRNIVIPCSFDSYPEPTRVYWKKDDKVINQVNGIKYHGSSVGNASLTILDVNNTDSGIYVCFVENQIGWSSGKAIHLTVNESSKEKKISSVSVPAVVGSVIALFILISTTLVVVFFKKKRNTFNENRYEATRGIRTIELHVYDETQRLNSNAIKSPVYAYASSILKSNQNALDMTMKRYDLRDFMHFLQDKSSLTTRIEMEYQLLNSTPELTAAPDYESVDKTPDVPTEEDSANKSLIENQDDSSGYIITTVRDRSDMDTFWTMITECRAEHIVLLLQKKEKISRFFPSTDVPINTSTFRVELSSSEKYPNDIFAFILAVWNKENRTEVQVKLCKTTDWNVGEKHPSIDTLCSLLDVVSNQSGMAVLIGSAGVGFPVCGPFGVCHEVFRAIKDGKDFNIMQIVTALKKKQPDLFQTFEDYNLCYKVIGNFLEKYHAYEVID